MPTAAAIGLHLYPTKASDRLSYRLFCFAGCAPLGKRCGTNFRHREALWGIIAEKIPSEDGGNDPILRGEEGMLKLNGI
ncbi:hypothetical protein [Phormidium sp. CCY1219]|uniref:hypothetical protein n=1 Tax=Phormidium sp. CCY1219 TaxID=2886104 RepID=UPI002D1ECD47|nr:hypothetical protein [Phormidium sp. CCY1219]MEB3828402.1 hypothetical protein [Phormidium sp. CCY1219]